MDLCRGHRRNIWLVELELWCRPVIDANLPRLFRSILRYNTGCFAA